MNSRSGIGTLISTAVHLALAALLLRQVTKAPPVEVEIPALIKNPVLHDKGPPPEFDAGRMTPPRMISGPALSYTEKALEREIEGLMIVQCVLTTGGEVCECRVQKGLAFMNASVIHTLEQRRYSPALLHGEPVEVIYTFKINLSLPR